MFWNRRYDPAGVAIDRALPSALRNEGIDAESFDGALLHEPAQLTTTTGGFYKVYGAFWKLSLPRGQRCWMGNGPRQPSRERCLASLPDLTNQATLRIWLTVITVADICWGTFLTTISATVGFAAAKRFSRSV